ncbi:MAG TPA: hypothetical protein PLS69_06930 [Terricaulis sp.]|nr:hypothetical protein [Terricaulis sp.]HRP11932.1 hypothetical protein [Terricaulis sp.]
MLKSKRKSNASRAPSAPSRALAPWGGEVVDVDRFWAESWIDLLNRQRWMARRLKLETAPWVVDQNAGIISFARKDGAQVTAPVQIIGAWNPRTEIFRWGWDHPMVVQRLRNDAERTRWFGDKHELEELTTSALKMSEQDAWQMTALAMKVNASYGVYRAPTEGPVIFMTLGQPKVVKA